MAVDARYRGAGPPPGTYGTDAESGLSGRQSTAQSSAVYESRCMRCSDWIKHRIAGCLGCCCGQALGDFVVGQASEEGYKGAEGSPLWTYFKFQQMLKWFWLWASLLQLGPFVYAICAKQWMGFGEHHHDGHDYVGGMFALFIGSWKEGDQLLKWWWYFANIVTMFSAVFLPIHVGKLADWRNTHPSIRHLLSNGRIWIHLCKNDKDTNKDAGKRRQDVLDQLRVGLQEYQRTAPKGVQGRAEIDPRCETLTVDIPLQAKIKDGISRTDFIVDLNTNILQRISAVVGPAGKHIAKAEICTRDQKAEIDELRGLRAQGMVRVERPKGATLEATLGCRFNKRSCGNKLMVTDVTPECAGRLRVLTEDGDEAAPLEVPQGETGDLVMVKAGCRLYKVGHRVVDDVETAEQCFAEAGGMVTAEFVGLGDYLCPCCRCIIKKEKCRRFGRVLQQAANVLLFAFLTLASAALVRWLTQEKKVEKHLETLVLVSLALVLVKAIFEKVSGVLGGSAFGQTSEGRETAALVQRLAFKVVVLLVCLWMLAPQTGRCPEDVLAGTLLVYMLIDYGVGWLLQFLMPVLLNFVAYCTSKDKAAAERAPLELHEEYLDVIYNQFVLYLAVPLFPGAALLGLLFNHIEGRIDRWKLQSGFVRKPEDNDASDVTTQINSVQACLSVLIFVAAVVPRMGILFVLNGDAVREGDSGTCFFPDWNATTDMSMTVNGSIFSMNWFPGVQSLENSLSSHLPGHAHQSVA